VVQPTTSANAGLFLVISTALTPRQNETTRIQTRWHPKLDWREPHLTTNTKCKKKINYMCSPSTERKHCTTHIAQTVKNKYANHRSVLYKSKIIRKNIQQMCPTMFWGKVHLRTGHKGPEVEKKYSSTLYLTSALDGVGGQCHAPATLPPGNTR